MTSPMADVATGRYLWLDVHLPSDPRLAFLSNSLPSPITPRETWHVAVQEKRSGIRVRTERDWTTARDEGHLAEIVYGAVHDRVLSHARREGWFRLHMALVEIGRRRVGLVGHSGAGKSTTAVALSTRGAKIHGDDVVFTRDGLVLALPRPLHLRPGVGLRLAGDEARRAHRLSYDPPVFVLDPGPAGWAPVDNDPRRLDLLVVLGPSGHGAAGGDVWRALVELIPDAGAFNPAHGALVEQVMALLAGTPVLVIPRADPARMARAIEDAR